MNREGALKVVLVLVGLLFSAGVYPLIMLVKQDRGGDDDEPLCNARHFPAGGSPQPVRQSQPHRFHGMVEPCPRCRDGVPGLSQSDRTRGADRRGCPHCDRRSPDCARSGKAIGQAQASAASA